MGRWQDRVRELLHRTRGFFAIRRIVRPGLRAARTLGLGLVAAAVILASALGVTALAHQLARPHSSALSPGSSLAPLMGFGTPAPTAAATSETTTATPVPPNCADCADTAVVTFTNLPVAAWFQDHIRVGLESTAQVPAQQFDFHIVAGAANNLPRSDDYSDMIWSTCTIQQACVVPADCATNQDYIPKADRVTGLNMGLITSATLDRTVYDVISDRAIFDHSSIICLPSAGYTEPTQFGFWLSESMSETFVTYKKQDIRDFVVQTMKNRVPPGYVYELTRVCADGFLEILGGIHTDTSADVQCPSQAIYSYDWNPAKRFAFAALIAGHYPDQIGPLYYGHPGSSGDYKITLSNGTRFPSDPARITVNVIPQ
jgi:hypothetical protein